ncbi:MAG: SPOR domain-containing protein [Rhodobacteraceae bacterium]|nr:SPOR domain-containing protein [Paracoccaceae bacterium]
MLRMILLALVAMPCVVSADPAELPPADFAGAEFVDSTGCAYWRMTLDGAPVWAARIGTDGAPVCGQQPSVAPPGLSDLLPAIPPNRKGEAPQFPQDGRYAQVASFRTAKKADEITALLQAQGLSVLRQDYPRRSGALRVLYVGPLGDEDTARDTLRSVRRLGFRDAFLRVQGDG